MPPREPLVERDPMRNRGRTGHCPRCSGFMVITSFEEWGTGTMTQMSPAWRCVLCGEVIDPIIVANRRQRRPPATSESRARLPIGVAGQD